ncbi:NUMOD4 motif-containing HNH endonuclease [Brevundimonas sp. M1A4_2e]
MEEEIWKPIPGSKGYEASTFGRIRSRKCILKPQPHKAGYWQVKIVLDGAIICKTVHWLVALTFFGPRPEGMEVCHWDGDKSNNGPFNLRYATRAENVGDNRRNGVFGGIKRDPADLKPGWDVSSRKGKLTYAQRREIVEIAAANPNLTFTEIGNRFGVAQQSVGNLWQYACGSVA